MIYIIKSLNTEKYYIGKSDYKYTSLVLHKYINSYKKYVKERKSFNTVFNIIDNDDVYIEEILNDTIENYVEKNRDLLVDDNNCVKNYLTKINIHKVKVNKKEYLKKYYEENKDSEKTKQYYEENKNELKQKSRKRYMLSKTNTSLDITQLLEFK